MASQTSADFFHLACSPAILGNALKVSLVVGSVLNTINQGEAIFSDNVEFGHFVLNYLVPFCVATYSGTQALQEQYKAASIGERRVQQTS